MSYEDTLGQLTAGLQRILEQVWQAVERGDLTTADFERLAAQIIAGTNSQAFTMGELSIRAYIESETGVPTPIPTAPAPAPHVVDLDRLGMAMATIVASDLDTTMQLARIAAGEPTDAAARGASDAMQRTEAVSGWKRGLEAKACQLCVWWWREGRIWQDSHPMPRHTGCMCHPVPVVNVVTANQQTTKQAGEAAASRRGKVAA